MEQISRPKITRTRELRACVQCRKRKLRCDRQSPCTSCAKRNEADDCIYERTNRGRQDEYERRIQAEARLEHLELLVQQLSQPQSSSSGMTDDFYTHSDSNTPPSLPSESVYNGSTHWSGMLEDIDALRSVIAPYDIDDTRLDLEDVTDGTSVLFGAKQHVPYQEVLANFLPPRREADRLVATYFRAKALAAPCIHSGQFSRLYQAFWDDQLSTSPLWTSILFSILDISANVLSRDSPTLGNNIGEAVADYRYSFAAAHCLALGEYYKPKAFAVEALLLFSQRKCVTNFDMPQDLAVIFGTLIRLAISMGYHRDASKSPNMSAFEVEMRRRSWSLCIQLDLLISFQLGLPSNIQYPTWDSKPPANLFDSDFDENAIELPPSKPDSEVTELLLYIAKHKLMAVFEKIVRHTLSTIDSPATELTAIDQELRNTYSSLPEVLLPRTVAASIADSPSLVVTRLCVDFLYQKCLCVLHRKHVIHGRKESVQICYDAASDIIQRFLDVYEEFLPGGQLEAERWFMSSITWHDFLHGCTTLCLILCVMRPSPCKASSNIAIVSFPESLELLQGVRSVCARYSIRSKDTQKVRQLVEVTIARFSHCHNQSTVDQQTQLSEIHPLGNSFINTNGAWSLEDSAVLVDYQDEWTYMGQFLDLSEDGLMTHT